MDKIEEVLVKTAFPSMALYYLLPSPSRALSPKTFILKPARKEILLHVS